MPAIEYMQKIARESLQDCYHDGRILASPTHFSDFWARDTFWAIGGILAIGEQKIAKNCIDYFLLYQNDAGKIPRKISRDITTIKYLLKKKILRKNPKPVYAGLVPGIQCVDDNSLLVRATWQYFQKTKDKESLQIWYPKLKKAITWYERRKRDHLVYEGLLSNWMDTVFKSGAVLYSNCLYTDALKAFSHIARSLGETTDATRCADAAIQTKTTLQTQFWNESFFSDTLTDTKHLDAAGNILACLFDIATDKQKSSVIKKLLRLSKNSLFLDTTYPQYPFYRINPVTRVVNIPDYQNGTSWLWINILFIQLLHKNEYIPEAEFRLDQLEALLKRDGEVGETYFLDGQSYRKRFWKSATPFAWSSGLLLETLDLYEKNTL